MKLEIIEIQCISMFSNSCIFHAFLEIFKSYEFSEFLTKFLFLALDQIQKLQKMRKKSLWSKNDLYRNKTADINVMQLSMIKFISWQALKMGPKPYYLAPTLWILYRRYSKELFNRSFLAF